MLPHCVPANVKKELDVWVEDGEISTWDEMWRAFRKEEVAALPHHAQRRIAEDVGRRHPGGKLAGLSAGIPPVGLVCRGLEGGVGSRPGVQHAAVQVVGEGPSGGAEAGPIENRSQDSPAPATSPGRTTVDQLLGHRALRVRRDEERRDADHGGPQNER